MRYEKLPINSVELDLNNPRIKQWLEIYGDNVTSEGISLALRASSGSESTSSYTALKESIRVNGGIINPIIVNEYPGGKKVVVEGNTRLQIYKEFAKNDPEGPWNEIIAIVYENLPVNDIHAIRLQTHLVGPRDWDPFSKAKYLNQLSNIDKLPMSTIISFCGGKDSEIRRLIEAYNDMIAYYFPAIQNSGDDPDPREFSKFAELQNRSVYESLAIHHYTKNDYANWVVSRNIDNALNVRKLPAVLADNDAKDVFLKSNISEAMKHLNSEVKHLKDLSNVNMHDLVLELTKRLRNIALKEIKALMCDKKKVEEKDDLFILQGELSEVLCEIGEE